MNVKCTIFWVQYQRQNVSCLRYFMHQVKRSIKRRNWGAVFPLQKNQPIQLGPMVNYLLSGN